MTRDQGYLFAVKPDLGFRLAVWLGLEILSAILSCVILTGTISGLTPSERNSLNRDHHDFCVNVKTFLELFVTREKPNIFTCFHFAERYRGP